MIKSGYNAELDSIVADMNNSSDILADIEAKKKKNKHTKAESRLQQSIWLLYRSAKLIQKTCA